jgi:LCP family protein required for cell wall assembly
MAVDPSTEREAGDPPARGTPSRRRRLWLVVGLIAVVVVVVVVGVGVALLRNSSVLHRSDLLPPEARADPAGRADAVRGPLNFLLIGSDLRAETPDEGQRADTIIIAHVSRSLDRAYLVSIPRDLLVEIPPVEEFNFGGDTTKINAAFDYGGGGPGGTQVLSLTLNRLMGIRFDGAAVIEFEGLRRAVDALGGVEICVDVRVASIHTPRVFEPGCRVMNGDEVLDYLRQRAFVDGDFSRQRHHQEFVRSFLDRARSSGVLANPMRVAGLVDAMATSITLDTGGVAIRDLVVALRKVSPQAMVGVQVPNYLDNIGGVSFVIAADGAQSLYDAVRDDTLDRWAAEHPQWVS